LDCCTSLNFNFLDGALRFGTLFEVGKASVVKTEESSKASFLESLDRASIMPSENSVFILLELCYVEGYADFIYL
jgi:hypothetical protein